MIKKVLPYLLAVLVFFVALALLRPAPQTQVVVAAADLPAGRTLAEGDLALKPMPQDLLPTEGVITDVAQAVGQTLRVERTAGDVILTTHLGGEAVNLAPDERAVAVQVNDSAGLAGLLKPGDRVGVTAILTGDLTTQGVFSKAVVENLRVLYIQPSFVAEEPGASAAVVTPDPLTGIALQRQREKQGVVILAVPVKAQAVVYDFRPWAVRPRRRCGWSMRWNCSRRSIRRTT